MSLTTFHLFLGKKDEHDRDEHNRETMDMIQWSLHMSFPSVRVTVMEYQEAPS